MLRLKELLLEDDLSQICVQDKIILLKQKDPDLDDLIYRGFKINKQELGEVFTYNLKIRDYQKLGFSVNDIIKLKKPFFKNTAFERTLIKDFPREAELIDSFMSNFFDFLLEEENKDVDLKSINKILLDLINNFDVQKRSYIFNKIILLDEKYHIFQLDDKMYLIKKSLNTSFCFNLCVELADYLLENYSYVKNFILTIAVGSINVKMVEKLLKEGYKLNPGEDLSSDTGDDIILINDLNKIIDLLFEYLDPIDIWDTFLPELKFLNLKNVFYLMKKMIPYQNVENLLEEVLK